jgi:hypothetical protein
MGIRSALSNTFQAKSRVDLETVEQKLAQAREALADAEAAGSLSAALSDDGNALDAVEQKLAAARRRVETLETALEEAEKIERARLAAAKTAQERMRINSIKQHAGAMTRNAQRITDGLAAAVAAHTDLAKDAGKIERLLTQRERVLALGNGNLEIAISAMIALEISRLARAANDVERLAFPNAGYSPLRHGGKVPLIAPPLADAVKARFDVSAFIGSLSLAQDAPHQAEAEADHLAALEPAEDEPVVELSAEDIAALTAAQEGHEVALRDGGAVSSVRLADNWHAHREGAE